MDPAPRGASAAWRWVALAAALALPVAFVADRKRFLLNRVPEDRAESPIVLVQSWRQRIERD